MLYSACALRVLEVDAGLDLACEAKFVAGVAARPSSAGPARRAWKWQVSKVERRALDDRAGLVDDKAKAPVLGKERYPIAAVVRFDSPFRQGGDLAIPHALLEERGLDPQPFSHDLRVDLNGPSSNAIACIV